MPVPCLRDYQLRGLKQLNARRDVAALYVAPTGSGKTRLATTLICGRPRGTTAWFAVHRHELVTQVSEALTAVGVPHGIVCLGYPLTAADVQIVMVQTVVRRLDQLQPPDLLVVDEAHHSVSPSYEKLFEFAKASRIVGLTATPERLDGRGLSAHFAHMVLGPQTAELIQSGALCRYRMWAPPGLRLEGIRIVGGDYAKRKLGKRIDKKSITGDAIEHYRRHGGGKRFIVFCASVEHSKHVAAQFGRAGITVVHIDADTPTATRLQAMADFRAGKIQGLSNVDLFGEGVDVPTAECVICLRPTLSLGLYLQQIGRVLRIVEGKEFAVILDHAGNVERHGLPDDLRHWSLAGRERRLEDEGVSGEGRARFCSECHELLENGATMCSSGHAVDRHRPRVLKHTMGELVEIERRSELVLEQELGKIKTANDIKVFALKYNFSIAGVHYRLRMLRGPHAETISSSRAHAELRHAKTYEEFESIRFKYNYSSDWLLRNWKKYFPGADLPGTARKKSIASAVAKAKTFVDFKNIQKEFSLSDSWVTRNYRGTDKKTNRPWTKKDDQRLSQLWGRGLTQKKISTIMGRHAVLVGDHAAKLGLSKSKWQMREYLDVPRLIKLYALKKTQLEMAEELGTTKTKVNRKISWLFKKGLLKKHPHNFILKMRANNIDIPQLIKLYTIGKTKLKMAEALGTTKENVANKIHGLLKKGLLKKNPHGFSRHKA